ncbi:MAG: hypothetical protein E6Q88_01355 [Lysobacteraceae bacterium]|nr:MAG: hypothetical protein E6Q88_01355 [Xanthomonadaceae bacterium]
MSRHYAEATRRMRSVPRAMAAWLLSCVMITVGCSGLSNRQPVAADVPQMEVDHAIVEVALGDKRLRVPREYLRHRLAPTSGRSLELVLSWPDLGPGAYPEPVEPLAAATNIGVTVLSAKQMPPATLAAWRAQYLKHGPDGVMVDAVGRSRDQPVFGLTPYYVTGSRSQRAAGVDWFFARPTPHGAATAIECTPRILDDGVGILNGRLVRSGGDTGVLAVCRHSFELPDGVIVHAEYPRAVLGHWKRIEAKVVLLLGSKRTVEKQTDRPFDPIAALARGLQR